MRKLLNASCGEAVGQYLDETSHFRRQLLRGRVQDMHWGRRRFETFEDWDEGSALDGAHDDEPGHEGDAQPSLGRSAKDLEVVEGEARLHPNSLRLALVEHGPGVAAVEVAQGERGVLGKLIGVL